MSLKSAVKPLLPARVKQAIGNMLVQRRERLLGRLPLQEAFEEVYRRDMWKQGDSRSGLGSEGPLAARYIELVQNYAAKHELRTAVDAGCGDFAVGRRLARNFERYMAFDISPLIIENNKRRYTDLTRTNVTFDVVDMTSATFPCADLILIRQVLQHLTNAQIEQILKNLEVSNWRRVLITEEVRDPLNNQQPNVDLPSHTVRTRVSLGSGVFLDKEPFNRPARRIGVIDDSADGKKSQDGLLVFELSRDP
jgi:SAM-dependent methyltransferase